MTCISFTRDKGFDSALPTNISFTSSDSSTLCFSVVKLNFALRFRGTLSSSYKQRKKKTQKLLCWLGKKMKRKTSQRQNVAQWAQSWVCTSCTDRERKESSKNQEPVVIKHNKEIIMHLKCGWKGMNKRRHSPRVLRFESFHISFVHWLFNCFAFMASSLVVMLSKLKKMRSNNVWRKNRWNIFSA